MSIAGDHLAEAEYWKERALKAEAALGGIAYVPRVSEDALAKAMRIVNADGDGERDLAHDDGADQVAQELIRIAGGQPSISPDSPKEKSMKAFFAIMGTLIAVIGIAALIILVGIYLGGPFGGIAGYAVALSAAFAAGATLLPKVMDRFLD